MKRFYIFDFDGMLVDSYCDSLKFFNMTLKQFNLPTFNGNIEGLDYQIFREFLKNEIKNREKEFNKQFTENYKEAPQLNTYPYKGIKTILKKLESQGIILGICSNREQKNLEMLVTKFFDDIDIRYVSGDKDGLHNKPDPYRLNEIIEKENIPKEEIIYFGDKIVDVLVAKNVGIDMVLVTYGQGNEEAYNDSYPLKIIDTPEEILDIFS